MQFGVIYLKTWGGKLVYVAVSTLEFRSCFFFLGGTHYAEFSYIAQGSICCVLRQVFLVSSLMELVIHVLLSKC